MAVSAPMAGGKIITRPLIFEGNRLSFNFSTSVAGSIQVEIEGADGTPVDGYRLQDSSPIFGDEVEREIRWKGGPDVGKLAGRLVRLRFILKEVDLFAFRFQQE